MTDQEINDAVSRKLGWNIAGVDPAKSSKQKWIQAVPDYCRSIEAAFEIVKKIADENERKGCGPILRIEHDGQWHCRLGVNNISQATTAPMAICLAFLEMEYE